MQPTGSASRRSRGPSNATTTSAPKTEGNNLPSNRRYSVSSSMIRDGSGGRGTHKNVTVSLQTCTPDKGQTSSMQMAKCSQADSDALSLSNFKRKKDRVTYFDTTTSEDLLNELVQFVGRSHSVRTGQSCDDTDCVRYLTDYEMPHARLLAHKYRPSTTLRWSSINCKDGVEWPQDAMFASSLSSTCCVRQTPFEQRDVSPAVPHPETPELSWSPPRCTSLPLDTAADSNPMACDHIVENHGMWTPLGAHEIGGTTAVDYNGAARQMLLKRSTETSRRGCEAKSITPRAATSRLKDRRQCPEKAASGAQCQDLEEIHDVFKTLRLNISCRHT